MRLCPEALIRDVIRRLVESDVSHEIACICCNIEHIGLHDLGSMHKFETYIKFGVYVPLSAAHQNACQLVGNAHFRLMPTKWLTW